MMNFNRTVISILAFLSLTVGCSIGVAAQTGSSPSTNRLTISESKQLKPSTLNSALAVSEPVTSEPAVSVRSTNDPRTELAKPNSVPPPASDDQWHFQFAPYLWVVGVSGRAGIGTLTTQVDSGLGDSNVHLNFAFMGSLEARRKKFAVVTDLLYANLGTERPTPGPLFSNATADFKAFMLDPEVAYRITANPDKGTFVDVLGGIRYWHLRADLGFDAALLSARAATGTKAWADGVIGMRGRAAISRKVFVLGKADPGGGGSKFTYQLFGGVGFKVCDRGSLIGGYRYLRVNYDKNNFLFDGSLSGPIVGVSFRLK